MPDGSGLLDGAIRRIAPAALRARVFDCAVADAARERRIRLRRARGPLSRLGIHLLFAGRAVSAAFECRSLARAEERPPGASGWRSVMVWQDFAFAFRMMRKAPGFTAAAVLAIALGVGANTAIFTVIEHVLLRPLPYPDAGRVIDVDEVTRGQSASVSAPNFADWRTQNTTLSSLGAYNSAAMTLSGGGIEPTRIDSMFIDDQVLPALGVQPLLGRTFTTEDMRIGARNVVLLGAGLWRRFYGGDRSIVGRTIMLEGDAYEVAGIMPDGFDFPGGVDLWVPLQLSPGALAANQRGAHYLSAVGRLRPGATIEQARTDLNRIESAIAQQYPTKVKGYSVGVEPLLQSMVGPVQRPLLVLFGAGAFVLLIACVNVSNLLLARATTRTGEIAVRSALGARRGRLIRQLLAESVMLALAGGVAGVMVGSWGVRALMTLAPADLPRAGGIGVDAGVLAFSIAVSCVAGLVFGLAPALVSSRPDLTVFLKDVRRDGGAMSGRRRLRSALVAAQVALALVLLAGAGLAVRSFERLTKVNAGVRTDGVLTVSIALPAATYPTVPSQTQFFREMIERLQQQPGIVSAGAVLFPPLTPSGFGGTFDIIDRPDGANAGNAQVRSVTPGYFETLAIPLRAGRTFDRRDSETGPPVAIISESTARKYWPGENPIGKRLHSHVGVAQPERATREIVGVVGDVHLGSLATDPPPVIYMPHTQYGPEFMTVVTRTNGDPMSALPAIKTVVQSTGRGVALAKPQTMEDVVAASVAEPRFRTILLSIFALTSLVLAAVGLYGVVAFSVSQRRSELGLRMALGADPRGVLRLVLREGMTPVGAGILAGLAGSMLLTRVMKTLLFGIDALDPITFGAVAATLALVALMACYVPARRATRLDPATTLR
jgi:putative ABC transport system permease protein